MKILIACEFSGRVRDAFLNKGHYAISVDLLPTESIRGDKEKILCSDKNFHELFTHFQGNILDFLDYNFDMMLAFPPCTHLSVSGARWFAEKQADGRQQLAIAFFMALVNAPFKKIMIENPIGIMSTYYRRPDQIIQPWQFGHGETKATCLWLKNLPFLKPTCIVEGRSHSIHTMGPSENRGKLRSLTYQGIADAMAEQWG